MKSFLMLLVAICLANTAWPQWVPQNSGTLQNLYSVHFPDSNTGYACGDSGILKTTNGGDEWILLDLGDHRSFSSVYFIDADTGYVVGKGNPGTACILKTTDGGINWFTVFTIKEFIGSWLTSVYFPDANTGYAVGYSMYNTGGDRPFIATTKNCGMNWTVNTSFPGSSYGGRLNSIHFYCADTGFAVGQTSLTGPYTSGSILSTNYGGIAWTYTGYAMAWASVHLNSVYFPCRDTGYAAGNVFLKTVDGGSTWTNLGNATGSSVFFNEALTGYLVGGSGSILKTTDGAASWMTLSSGTTAALRSVFFTDVDTGYVVGSGGLILKTTNGGGPAVGVGEITDYGLRITNFPNPAGQSTTFYYTLSEKRLVILQIFNNSGQLVSEPLHEFQNRGEQKVTWNTNSQPAGYYYCRIQAGNRSDGIMILVVK